MSEYRDRKIICQFSHTDVYINCTQFSIILFKCFTFSSNANEKREKKHNIIEKSSRFDEEEEKRNYSNYCKRIIVPWLWKTNCIIQRKRWWLLMKIHSLNCLMAFHENVTVAIYRWVATCYFSSANGIVRFYPLFLAIVSHSKWFQLQ